jgi:hypothetical protein
MRAFREADDRCVGRDAVAGKLEDRTEPVRRDPDHHHIGGLTRLVHLRGRVQVVGQGDALEVVDVLAALLDRCRQLVVARPQHRRCIRGDDTRERGPPRSRTDDGNLHGVVPVA